MIFDGFPFIIGWELTLACNLRCRHCGSSAENSRDDELTLDEAISICDQFPELLVQEVNFTGGEPLLRKDWMKLATHLRKLSIKTKVLTNGLVIDANVIDQMIKVGIAGIGISLDGLKSTHEYIRGRKGLFRETMNGIELVIEAGIPLTLITTVNALNIKQLPSLFGILKTIGIRSWQIQPIFPFGRAKHSAELGLTPRAYLDLGDFFRNWRSEAEKVGMEILPGDSFGYYTDCDSRDPPWGGCTAGLISCGITSDGKIKGCLSLPDELTEGDLRKKDLWDIWFHPDSFTFTRKFTQTDLGTVCRSCEKGVQCKGGCSAMSYGATGNFHNDPYCFYGIKSREV
jgi:radical SAM protein with 4Fe4S-binding SPASM domain